VRQRLHIIWVRGLGQRDDDGLRLGVVLVRVSTTRRKSQRRNPSSADAEARSSWLPRIAVSTMVSCEASCHTYRCPNTGLIR
jgi:hypothetical protein